MDEDKLVLRKPRKSAGASTGTVKKLAGTGKDKGFSVKTTASTFGDFTAINRYYGMSNNSVINQLMVKYIRENQNVLDEIRNGNDS